MNIVWHSKAEIDLSDLSDYIAQDNPSAALRVFRKVVTATEQLAAFPQLGRDGRIEGTRELVVSGLPYIVVVSLSIRDGHYQTRETNVPTRATDPKTMPAPDTT